MENGGAAYDGLRLTMAVLRKSNAPGRRKRGAAPASDAVRKEWARRVQAEYHSAAVTQHLTLWLIQIGAPMDLIEDGLGIVSDELAHAELSHGTFVAAGGKSMAPLARESLALPSNPREPLEFAVTRWGVEIFCLGETVAVPLFRWLREDCRAPSARKTLDRILRDEVRHRDFGWALLEYLMERAIAPQLRTLIDHELEGMFTRIRRSYAPVGGETLTEVPETDRAWGLMPVARYAAILEQTVKRDYRPRFRQLGFEIEEAWQRAVAAQPKIGSPPKLRKSRP